ncbi:hypothetical protein RN001_000910 [Aquatica leii]|uniref:Uncharacterized protein n=1 Tax=Aquatica leii TaxID=1421715 RepID=A0AAN7SKW2_9COLE|nr:hypothetical protein RN001_000910 [Aquatica leii]
MLSRGKLMVLKAKEQSATQEEKRNRSNSSQGVLHLQNLPSTSGGYDLAPLLQVSNMGHTDGNITRNINQVTEEFVIEKSNATDTVKHNEAAWNLNYGV